MFERLKKMLSLNEREGLKALLEVAGDKDVIDVIVRDMCKEILIHRSTMNDLLRLLQLAGYIKVTHKGCNGSRIKITDKKALYELLEED